MKNEDLTIGKPYIAILKFALPLMIACILQQFYNTADTFIVGNFDSENSLAAVGSCFNLVGLYVMISVGLSLGVGILISQAFGAKNEELMKKYAGNGCIFLILSGILVSLFSYFTASWFLNKIIAVPKVIFEPALVYAQIYSVGLFFQFGYNAFASVLRAVGNSKSSLYFLILTTIVNIALDLIFVISFKLSVVGVALATTISQAIAMLVSFIYLIKKYPLFRPSVKDWRLNYRLSVESAKNGLPLSFQAIIVNVGFMILLHIVNSFGTEMTASFTVANRLEFYMLIPMIVLWDAVATFSGQNFGAKQEQRLITGMKQTIWINIIIALSVGFFCFLFANQLAALFAIKGTALKYATIHLRVVACDLLFYALYSPITATSVGVKKSYIVSVVSFIELSGRILFAYLLSFSIGPACIWFNEPIAWAIVTVFVYIYYFKVLKKTILIK